PGPVDATINVDTLRHFQTMTGWEATAQADQEDPGFSGWQNQLMDLAGNDLGINRLRVEVTSGAENPADNFTLSLAGQVNWSTVRYQAINDNNDPNVINPAGFHFSQVDLEYTSIVLPLRQRLEARGEHLYLNLNYVSFNHGGVIHGDPAEYAEFLLALFLHLRDTFGVVPDAVEVILEPDNGTIWTGSSIGAGIAAAGQRLAAAGFHPDFIAPSVTNMANAVPYLNAMVQVPGVAAYLKEFAYHRYAGVSAANLQAIASRGAALGLRTAMLEHIGSGVEDLYDDLTIGQVSAWQQFTLAFPGADNGAQYYSIVGGVPVIGSRTLGLRQYFRYVRAGAVRVGAASDNAAVVRPVAFTNVGNAPVVVLHMARAAAIALHGLRPGNYGVTTSDPAHAALADLTAGAGGSLTVNVPSAAIVTVYSKP
ncbi:MAG: hypothetical protein ACREK8_11380, partial [Gemmatimonadales bacterium]